MYSMYNDDDDCDAVRTRGQDMRNHLRLAAQAAGRVQDPAAREAITELVDALRLISEVLYDLSEPPRRRIAADASSQAPFSLS